MLIAHAEGARHEGAALTAALDESARRLHDRISVDGCCGARRIRDRPGDGADQLPERRPGASDLHAAPAVRIGRRRCGRRWFRTPRPRHRSPSSRATAPVGSARVGTAADPGTALFSLSGAIARPGVYEAALGVPLKALVGSAGGLAPAPARRARRRVRRHLDRRAVSVGPHPRRRVPGLPRRPPLESGRSPCFPRGPAAVCETARIARYLARESAGHAVPAFTGSPRSRAGSIGVPTAPTRPPRRRGARTRRVPSPGRRCAARSFGSLRSSHASSRPTTGARAEQAPAPPSPFPAGQ